MRYIKVNLFNAFIFHTTFIEDVIGLSFRKNPHFRLDKELLSFEKLYKDIQQISKMQIFHAFFYFLQQSVAAINYP